MIIDYKSIAIEIENYHWIDNRKQVGYIDVEIFYATLGDFNLIL